MNTTTGSALLLDAEALYGELLRGAPVDAAVGQGGSAPEAVPRLRQAHSDELLGPRAPIRVASEDFGLDVGPGLAVLTGDVPLAATPEQGRLWFDRLVDACRKQHDPVETGEFGAHMVVSLVNDGPVTFWLSR